MSAIGAYVLDDEPLAVERLVRAGLPVLLDPDAVRLEVPV
jgi:hypothetical protein